MQVFKLFMLILKKKTKLIILFTIAFMKAENSHSRQR